MKGGGCGGGYEGRWGVEVGMKGGGVWRWV